MTTPDPIRTYLGMSAEVPPHVLLGLTPDAMNDARRVRAALAIRLGQIDRHPMADAPDADLARARVRDTAERVIGQLGDANRPDSRRHEPVRVTPRRPVIDRRPVDPPPASPRPGQEPAPAGARSSGSPQKPVKPVRKPAGRPSPTPPAREQSPRRPASVVKLTLTPFDRDVLSILISCRGWNADSRARLVALASDRGVSGAGLLKVVEGLANHARRHGARLALSEIADDSSGPLFVPRSRLAQREAAASDVKPDGAADEIGAQRHRRAFGIMAAVTIVVAALVLAAGVIALALVDAAADPGRTAEAEGDGATVEPSMDADADGPMGASPTRLADWPDYPSFRGNAVPAESAEAADKAVSLAQSFDQRGRELAVEDDPSERIFRLWDADVTEAGAGWFLIDRSTRAELRRELIHALHEAAGRPSVSDRLLDSLRIAASPIADPVELWRNAFRAGMLAEIRTTESLPRAIRDRAGVLLRSGLPPGPGPTPSTFTAGVRAMLAAQVDPLVETTELSEDYADQWEMWLAAARSLASADSSDAERDLLLLAAGRILAESADLSDPGPLTNVLGRLVQDVGTWDEPSPLRWIEGLFRDDQGVTSDDLWILTSLMIKSGRTPWLTERHVLPPGESLAFRNRIRDAVIEAWPDPLPRDGEMTPAGEDAVLVSAGDLARWRRLLDAVDVAAEPRGGLARWSRVLVMARLGEAAALLANGEAVEAIALMDELDALLAARSPQSNGGVDSPVTAPQPATPEARRSAQRALTNPLAASPRPPGPAGPRPYDPSDPGKPSPPIPLPPSSPQTGPTIGQPSGALGPDGTWAARYNEARPNADAQLRLLRALRSSAGGDLGPRDAEVFVRAAYLGAPEAVRSLARDIAIEQFSRGRTVVTELLDQFPLAPRHESTADLIEGVTSRVLPFAPTDRWIAAARLGLVEHLLFLWGEAPTKLDGLAEELADCYARRAALVRLGLSGPDADHGASAASVEQSAEALATQWQTAARRIDVLSVGPVGSLADLRRRQSVRDRLAHGARQRIVAHRVTAIEHHAHLFAANWPIHRDEVAAVLRRSLERRQSATEIMTQMIQTERASLELWRLELQARLDRAEEPSA